KTLIRGQDLTRENLKEEFFQSSVIVSFNGKRFDQPFLEKSFNMQIENPHLDLMYTCRRLGYSGGLKKIEKEMDIERELEDLDGREAIRLWKKYEKEGDEEALRKLVEYNQYDTVNLRDLLERTHNRLRADIFEPHLD
ncbi:MAG: exonuclease, partial [Nanohaloarchaea archaeon SW_7_46_7]